MEELLTFIKLLLLGCFAVFMLMLTFGSSAYVIKLLFFGM